ncbi:uncharacterized protein JCM15063_004600 [Sporobolomyces koalae]|uniref:uncharacterized protein n=1 Tax=Sporobolomyces koalae TaxID=500713 RepID=UPI0031753C68
MAVAGPSTRFIFSYNADDEDVQALAALVPPEQLPATFASRRHGLGATRSLGQDDEFVPYGPTTYRKGPLRFVPAREGGGFLGGHHDEHAIQAKVEGKGKLKAEDQDCFIVEDEPEVPFKKIMLSGNAVKGLYAQIVGIRPDRDPAAGRPNRQVVPEQLQEEGKPELPPEADLVLSSDPESESELPNEATLDDLDDDIIIIDPIVNLPGGRSAGQDPTPVSLRKPKNLQPRLIHELLSDTQDAALVPPTYYALPETNLGYRLLAKQGWKAGETLGPAGNRGLKVPLRAVEKFDRKGLGRDSDSKEREKLTPKEREQERARLAREEVDERGKGSRGIAKKQKLENAERKAWISYMNR